MFSNTKPYGRFWTIEKYETFRIHFNDLTGTSPTNLYNSVARIYTTQCFKKHACGLCGLYNDDPNDDFTYRIEYDNAITTNNFYIIDATNADDPNNLESWVRTQNFTVQWVNNDLSLHLRPNSTVMYTNILNLSDIAKCFVYKYI